jgi:hypothetical protein
MKILIGVLITVFLILVVELYSNSPARANTTIQGVQK